MVWSFAWLFETGAVSDFNFAFALLQFFLDIIGVPLGIVLLPSEHVPLHIFEPRYRELIAECLERQEEFGFIFADGDGVREVGTRARVIDVLEEFEDGRLNIVVEGGERFRVHELTRGRSFITATVEPLEDDAGAVSEETAARAAGAFRALAALAGAETDDPDERSPQPRLTAPAMPKRPFEKCEAR